MTIRDVENEFDLLEPHDDVRFEAFAQIVLGHQLAHNPVYAAFAESARYLPVEAFKRADVTAFPPVEAVAVFRSSGTGSGERARHLVRDLSIYERSVRAGFRHALGPGPFVIVGHLPSYAGDSSLVHMVEQLARETGDPTSGLFLDDRDRLRQAAERADSRRRTLVVFGVSFGLLDLVRSQSEPLPTGSIVIETGGMKTHRRVVSRAALHGELAEGFGLPLRQIRSEYGMCELFSQCYTDRDGRFRPPPWMRVEVLDPADPARVCRDDEEGVLAVMDLANLHTASALLTGDRAVAGPSGFEILGRWSPEDLRGCNFLMESP